MWRSAPPGTELQCQISLVRRAFLALGKCRYRLPQKRTFIAMSGCGLDRHYLVILRVA